MQMNEFEWRICRLLQDPGYPSTGFIEESLTLSVCADGCLSASFRGELIPCEGYYWGEALDKIVEFIEAQLVDGQLPPRPDSSAANPATHEAARE